VVTSVVQDENRINPIERSETVASRGAGLVRRVAMRPRRALVKLHRWLSFGLMAWLLVISVTGAWLTVHHAIESRIHSARYANIPGDVGPEAANAAATTALGRGAVVAFTATPRTSRGVYEVLATVPVDPDAVVAEGETPAVLERRVLVDPGSGQVNAVLNPDEGATHWLYRGHMTLWQDNGVFGVFDADDGWCRAADGKEPSGLKGAACNVIPNGDDMVAWFAVGWIIILLVGFHLWFWPGVKRWSNALKLRRGRGKFAFNMSLHKVIGLLVWLPLTVVAFTGAAFAFPNMAKWYQNVTPGDRGFDIYEEPDDLKSSDPNGAAAIGLDRVEALVKQRYPKRSIDSFEGAEGPEGAYGVWVTSGYSPWTREGGGGNVYLKIDQYTGDTLFEGKPPDGNTFEQAWSNWSFPLHTGDFGGTTTRVTWMFIALSPLALGATGTILNRVRATKRKRATLATAASAESP
jgi:uncharacterized iron-regulated membrane protein